MHAVGVKTLKDRLSHYLRLVSSGETVLVTDRDKVVAELIPPGKGRPESIWDSTLAEAVKKGWLTPALSTEFPLPDRKPVASLAEILSEISRDREDR